MSRSVGDHGVKVIGSKKCKAVEPDTTASQAFKMKASSLSPSKKQADSIFSFRCRYH